MLSVRRHGHLALIEDIPEKQAIDRELRQLDPRLFCEMQLDVSEQPVWTIQLSYAGDKPPELVFEWRDDNGLALPITYKVLDKIRYMMARGPIDVQEIIERNRQLSERASQEASEQYREIGKEFYRRRNRSYLLPRSHQLYLSRARARGRGEQK